MRTTDSVNILTDRMNVYNRQFVVLIGTTDQVMGTTDREICLYHRISMNAESQEETSKKETADTK